MSIKEDFKNRIAEIITFDEKEKVKTSKKIGVDLNTLTLAIEYGKIPSVKSLIKISDYYNVSIDFILGNTEDDTFIVAKEKATFAERPLMLIKEKGITQYQLAKLSHIDKSYITKWLKGEFVASVSFLETLADCLNVSIDYLLGRTDYR